MSFSEKMRKKAQEMQKSLVLPEGTESRTQQAARIILDEKIASSVTLLGNIEEVKKSAASQGVDLKDIIIKDPKSDESRDAYADELVELRKHKGMTKELALEQLNNILNYGAMMVRKGDADAMVAGAENSTGNVLKAGFIIIKTAPGVKSASSCFVMDMPDKSWGEDGLMIFSDCATIPNPNPQQLAEITTQAADSCRTFLHCEPVVAMLSFSTKGSASHESVDKVTEALQLVKEMEPGLTVDGEMQLDAAIVPSVCNKKAPGSPVEGKANTLIFPDLQSGNIGYKLVQRFAKAGAYGPFLQGFAKPISDLSRGCSVEDIISTCAVTLTQCK